MPSVEGDALSSTIIFSAARFESFDIISQVVLIILLQKFAQNRESLVARKLPIKGRSAFSASAKFRCFATCFCMWYRIKSHPREILSIRCLRLRRILLSSHQSGVLPE